MKKHITLTAIATVIGVAAFGNTFATSVQTQLEEQGFRVTETSERRGMLKFEAVRGNQLRELVFDADTGALLKDEVNGAIIGGSEAAVSLINADQATKDKVAMLQAEGMDVLEVKTSNGMVKIEGVQDGQERELIIDASTGEILKEERGGVDVIDTAAADAFGDDDEDDDENDEDENEEDENGDAEDDEDDEDEDDDDDDEGEDDDDSDDDDDDEDEDDKD